MERQRRCRRRSPAGFSYAAVLIMTAALSVLAVAFVMRLGIGTAAVTQRSANIQAEYLAEAAVNHAIWRIMNEPGFPADPNVYTMHTFGAGRYGYRVRPPTSTTFATIAAVGVVGKSVVRESYVVGLFGRPSQMITGTYTGNGVDHRAITGVGFQPDVVILKDRWGWTAVVRTSTMIGDASKPMVGSTGLTANLIESLDPDGFTVGSDLSVNAWSDNFYWAAFRATTGKMAVGRYTGDGSANRVIGGLSFTPDLIVVMPEGAQEVLHRSNYASDSFNFGSGTAQVNCLTTPIPANGFRVGNDARVNAAGQVYDYVCWADWQGQQRFGGYTGDGTNNRGITGLGFAPELVIVDCVTAAYLACEHPASYGRSNNHSLPFTASGQLGNRIMSLDFDGFTLKNDNEVNRSGQVYVYYSWAAR